MDYEMAHWLLDQCAEPYTSTRHIALQVKAASFIATYDLEKWDAEHLRETFANFQFKLRIMEIRRRLSRPVYEEDHAALKKELADATAEAPQVAIKNTEDSRLRFTAKKDQNRYVQRFISRRQTSTSVDCRAPESHRRRN